MRVAAIGAVFLVVAGSIVGVPNVAHAPEHILVTGPSKQKKKVSERKVVRKVSRKLSSPSKRYAATLVTGPQLDCLLPLWQKESGWSPTSDNPTSSAYGIPQILGLEARTGDDYKAQVRAGLSYIKHRYGTPCRAWSFWQDHRWY